MEKGKKPGKLRTAISKLPLPDSDGPRETTYQSL